MTVGSSEAELSTRPVPEATEATQRQASRRSRATEPRGTLILNRYRLLKPLGAGGFGTVWLVYDERLEREVAVKMLPRARVIGGRFEREARAAARLNHPGIVTLYEAAVDDDAAYLVSELVRGATFADLLEGGRLSDRDIVMIGIALCDALAHAHSQGVVHRDVKPSNILVPERPSSPAALAKLTDFGVARVIGGNTLTRTGEVIGTASYMSPEQSEGRAAGAAADLYSLALVLYEALTGLNPIATGPAAANRRRLGLHLPPLRRYRRDLPRNLGRALDLALRPRVGERGTLAELRSDLLEALDEVGDEPREPSPAHPEHQHEPAAAGPSWPQSNWHANPEAQGIRAPAETTRPPADRPELPNATVRWPERTLAGAAAAAVAGWLAVTAFSTPPVPAPLAALYAAVAVATLPRLGWLALTLCSAGALALAGRPGAALIVGPSMLLPVVLLPRTPTRWPLAAAAPALGAVLLAGAWPALAARDHGIWRRAALAGLGWVWLLIAGLLAGHGLYARLPGAVHGGERWIGSPGHAIGYALAPLVRSGMLFPAVVWALAAALLPWIVRGPLAARVILVTVWSAAVASASTSALHGGATPQPGAVVVGALAGWIVALALTLLRARRRLSASADIAARLA